jgi:hypothetical protein
MHEIAIGKYGANWVLPLDADEFIIVPPGESVIATDARLDTPIAIPWRSYVPCDMDDGGQSNPVLRMRHRLRSENWPWIKVVIPAKLVAGTDIVIEQGSHGIMRDGQQIKPVHDGRVFLGHFPIRSEGQFLAKTVVGYLQNQTMTDAEAGWGFHHRDQFQKLRSDPSAVRQRFREVAYRYSVPPQGTAQTDIVDDPLPYRGGALRHTPALDDVRQAWLPILNYTEELARRYALLRSSVAEDGRHSTDREAEAFARVRNQLHVRDQLLLHEQAQTHLERQHKQAAEARLDAALARHRTELQRLEQSLRSSWSWRVGRFMTSPARWVKRRLGSSLAAAQE